MDQAQDIYRGSDDQAILTSLREAGLAAQGDSVDEISVKFHEHAERLQEVRNKKCTDTWTKTQTRRDTKEEHGRIGKQTVLILQTFHPYLAEMG